jgi:hypothetical protein
VSAFVSLDSPSCEVPCLILHSLVYRDVTRQVKGLHCLKYVGALERGLAYLSRCNSGWFYHTFNPSSLGPGETDAPDPLPLGSDEAAVSSSSASCRAVDAPSPGGLFRGRLRAQLAQTEYSEGANPQSAFLGGCMTLAPDKYKVLKNKRLPLEFFNGIYLSSM